MPGNPLSEEIYLQRTRKRKGDVRGHYFRDQTAIIHCRPFRRLKHKTQVFFAPDNDHVCTRMEHVMHVATIAATLCKGLNREGWNLDTELAYAIGLGHDLGHPPFGHSGEEAINEKLVRKGSFCHEMHSYRVAEHLAYGGDGLNLTYAVKDGIICHNGEHFERSLVPAVQPNRLEEITARDCLPTSYEGCIVRFSDKIAYLGRDIEDAVIARLIAKKDIPPEIARGLGSSNSEIIEFCVNDVIERSKGGDAIRFSDPAFELLLQLKRFNYERIYYHPKMRRTAEFCRRILHSLFDHLMALHARCGRDFGKYPESGIPLDQAFGRRREEMDPFYSRTGADAETAVTDFVAGMTDNYALEAMKQITLPPPLTFKA
ncbi:MAG: hypothetical protein A2X36_01940 [Elusimicrobia bacterium GWA2_69_24]|nr:MAG: hypothetical protein A2X36_01940 [Elusimicrobia bacterium GWA2_69_24]HBL16508.1 phosphohydrolase [Elusimicrobiota bacterium]